MHGSRQIWIAIGLLLLSFVQWGCMSVERRHRLAAIFFDDPPSIRAEADVDAEGPPEENRAHRLLDQSHHGPYMQKKCDICHESRDYSLNLASRLRLPKDQLCTQCHDPEMMFKGAYRHGPVNAGHCFKCHNPHRSKLPHLLLASGYDLCGRCHTEATVKNMDQHRAENGDDCYSCHNPHAADKPKLLR